MADRAALGAGCVYCGVFPLVLEIPYLTFFMNQPQPPQLAVLPFCLTAALVYLCNALLLHRGPTPPVLAVCNLPLWALVLGVTLVWSRFYSLGQGVFAGVLTLISCGVSVYTAFSPPTVPRLLTRCDVTALGMVWMCLLEAGDTIPPNHLLYYLAALLLVLAALLVMRAFGGSRDVVYGSRLWGGVMWAGLMAVIGGILYLLIRFLSGASRAAVSAVITGTGAVLSAIASALNRFFTWLVGLLPQEELEGASPELAPISGVGGEEELVQTALDPRILAALGIGAALIAAGVLIAVLFRLRGRRIRLAEPGQCTAPAGSARRTGTLARRWRALWFRLRFRAAFLVRRNSPTGLLVWLEGWGVRHGMPRGRGETHRAYLARLSALPALEDSPELPPLLARLADVLDGWYFGGRREGTLPAGAAAALRRWFKGQPDKPGPAQVPDGQTSAEPAK